MQPHQFLADDLQLKVEELGLLRIWWYPFQLFYCLFSYLQVLIMNGIQMLLQSLEKGKNFGKLSNPIESISNFESTF